MTYSNFWCTGARQFSAGGGAPAERLHIMFTNYVSITFNEAHEHTIEAISIDEDLMRATVEGWLEDESNEYTDILSECFRGVDVDDETFFDELATELTPDMLLEMIHT